MADHAEPCAVVLEGVSVQLGGVRVLQGCHLMIKAGHVHGLLGPSGSGKTVLLKVIATLLQPLEGEVSLFGRRVDYSDPHLLRDLRSRIGMQFQNLALFDSLTVGQNVAFSVLRGALIPEGSDIQRKVEEVLTLMGLPETSHLYPHELSGGMQRRVALARALFGNPPLCLLDEPTSGLDPVNSSRIFEMIKRYQRNTSSTVIIASQDLDRLLKVSDFAHVLDKGKVIFSGKPEEAKGCEDKTVRTFLTVFSGGFLSTEGTK